MNLVKLVILSDSEPFWLEKIGKVVNWVKLAILSDSEPLCWEKIGKVVNQAKLAILSDSELLWWEKLSIGQNWPFKVILGCFSGKRLEKLQIM